MNDDEHGCACFFWLVGVLGFMVAVTPDVEMKPCQVSTTIHEAWLSDTVYLDLRYKEGDLTELYPAATQAADEWLLNNPGHSLSDLRPRASGYGRGAVVNAWRTTILKEYSPSPEGP